MDYAKYLDHHLIGPTSFSNRTILRRGRLCRSPDVAAPDQLAALRRQAVEAVGRMALSNYLLQCILGTVIFFGYGMGYFGHLTQWQLYLVVAENDFTPGTFSVLWLRFFTSARPNGCYDHWYCAKTTTGQTRFG